MTDTERVRALTRFGYLEREASFLCLAALHGGYFLRRQVSSFIGVRDGGSTSELVEKALAKGHIKTSTWRKNTQLYHLCARPFYEALGQGDNRNRRTREILTIKNKVMGLDFVLAHRSVKFLATEQEKLDYFTGKLGLELPRLPAKRYRAAGPAETTTRYFVDKYPVFISCDAGEPSAACEDVSFCFVDEGMATLSRFESYLEEYASLFAVLPRFHLIYVSANARPFAVAQRVFERFLIRGTIGDPGEIGTPLLDRVLAYFTARRLYESGQTASFDRAKLIQLRDLRREFCGAAWENRYARWKAGGNRETLAGLWPETPSRPPLCASFSTFLLEHDYELFGHFPG